MTHLVRLESCGASFLAVDPASYPFAAYEFSDEAEIKADTWSNIQPGEVVLDLGASWGGWTLPALAQGAHVVAVEPSARSLETLRESVAANGWTGRLTPVRAMLWGNTIPPKEFMESAVLNFGGEWDVHVWTLDGLVEGLHLERLDRIKFDVEGAEHAILMGGHETLRRYRPLLVIEDHDIPEDHESAGKLQYAVGLRSRVKAELAMLGYEVEEYWQKDAGNPFLIGRATA